MAATLVFHLWQVWAELLCIPDTLLLPCTTGHMAEHFQDLFSKPALQAGPSTATIPSVGRNAQAQPRPFS